MGPFIAAAAALLIALFAAAPAGAAQSCPDAETKDLVAKDVRTKGGLDCGVATVVVRTYLREVDQSGHDPKGCAEKRFTKAGCRIGDFRCFARVTDAGEIRGRCGDGRLRVKFTEVSRARA